MSVFDRIRRGFERLLEIILLLLVGGLTAVVVLAVIYRKAGNSLSWYDEIASILLAWVTYYGAALAALKRSHIGFSGLLTGAPRAVRLPLFLLAEACVFGFFLLLAWVGWQVLLVLEGDTLISLPQVPTQLTQSVIPIGAALFVIAQALSLPEAWRSVAARGKPGGAENQAGQP